VESNVVRVSDTKMNIELKARAHFKANCTATNVEFLIPTPSDAANVQCTWVQAGTAKYTPEEDCIKWKIKALQGGSEASFNGTMNLPLIKSQVPEPLH
jgi:hypothetical protein